jgi:hypothetical protein
MFFVQIYGDSDIVLCKFGVCLKVQSIFMSLTIVVGDILFLSCLLVGWLVDLFTPTLTFAITFAILKIAT